MQVSKTAKNAVHTLVCATTDSKDLTSLQQHIADNKDDIVAALILIGITDSEALIDVAHMALFQVCPPELEEHVQGCAGVFIQLIGIAWNSHEEDVEAAINEWFEESNFKPAKKKKGKKAGVLPSTPSSKDVEHLNKCLNIQM